MNQKPDIAPHEFRIVRDILTDSLPDGCKVWAFGSRATGKAHRGSDLDLALEWSGGVLPSETLCKAKDAFTESRLPYSVDVLDLNAVSDAFRQVIRRQAIAFALEGPQPGEAAPRLRFRDDRGQPFPDWEVKRLGEVANVYQPETLSQSQLKDDGNFRVYGANGIIGRLDRFNHENEQVIVTCRGNTSGSTTFTKPKSWITGNAMVVNLDDAPKVSKRFVYNLFQQTDWTYLITGSGQPQITGDIKKHKLKLPHPSEQRRIADFLSSVDRRIDVLERQAAGWRLWKRGLMQGLFPQPGENVPRLRFRDDRGQPFPDWEVKRLGEVANIDPKSPVLPEAFLYIDLESVSQGRLTEPKQEYRDTAPSRAQRLLQAEDVLFQLVRPYQRNNYFFPGGETHVASTGYSVLRVKDCPAFVYQAVHEDRFVNRVLERCTGTNYPAINSNDLAQVKLSVPNPSEQRRIADFLSSVDRRIEVLERQAAGWRLWKRGLMQGLFPQ